MNRSRWGLQARVLALVFLVMTTISAAAGAAERDRAEAQAKAFMGDFGRGEYRKLYREYLGKRYKETVTEEAFVAQYSMVGMQAGGAGTSRRLIDERSLSQIPGPQGAVFGNFYFFRYKVRYPAGNAYEDVYLERESAGWRVVGCWLNPAPD